MFVTTLNIFLWKHWKCMRSGWFSVLLNIAFPVLMPVLLMYLSTVPENVYHPEKQFETFSTDALRESFSTKKLNFAPNNTFNFGLMEDVRVKLHLLPDHVLAFETEDQLNDYLQSQQEPYEFSVLFGESHATTSDQAAKLNYSILAVSDKFQTDAKLVNDFYTATKMGRDMYMMSGFTALQGAIDEAFADRLRLPGKEVRAQVAIEKMPSEVRKLFHYESIVLPMVILLVVYIFAIINTGLVPAVEEKESGIKEFLRIASSYSYMNMATFFVVRMLLGCLIFGVVLGFCDVYGRTQHFQMVYMLVLVVLYLFSIIAYTFMISVIFNTVFFAKIAGFLFYFGQFAVLLFPKFTVMAPILNNVVFVDGLNLFDAAGARAHVFDWSMMFESTDHSYSMFSNYMFLIMDTVVYLALYYYFIEVFPGTYGTPKSFLFPFQSSFWRRKQVGQNPSGQAEVESMTTADEPDVVVRVRGLTKEFRPLFEHPKLAVNNLSMDICKNQITVLLGHNGAGKTTTMSIISGIIPKTSGVISVDGEDNVDVYRQKIGYCPQHNIFLPYFTIKDHLLFFGGLRGLSSQEANVQSNGLLESLHLAHKCNEYGKDLSGGMKRRLCLGNAIIGNTQIAILDEPSSGLDPESRRELWNILLEMRKNHTILITTHYMEEAETLADHISIMSRGEILCHGTAMELKRKYADGYVLKLLTTPDFNADAMLRLVQRHIPTASTKSFVKPTINITLPYTHLDKYPELLAEIEQRQSELGISTISMTNATLEEVFLNCDPHKHLPEPTESIDQVDSSSYTTLNMIDPKNNPNIMCKQFLAIVYKKSLFVRSYWIYLLISFLMLVGAVALSYVTINGSDNTPTVTNRAPALAFSPDTADSTQLLLLHVQNTGEPELTRFADVLQTILHEHNVMVRNWTTGAPEELLAIERDNIQSYHEHTFGAIRVVYDKGLEVQIMFPGNVLHSSSRLLNLVDNVLARVNGGQAQIVTMNEPILKERQSGSSGGDFGLYQAFMPMALFMYMLFFVYLPFMEERSEFKKLQPISPHLYWATVYLFDALLHTVMCALLMVVHLIFDHKHFFGVQEYAYLFLIYALYGYAYLPLLYIAAQFMSTLSSLYSFLTYLFLIPNLAASFFSISEDNMAKYATWISILMVFPDYAVRHTLTLFFVTFDIKKALAHIEQLHQPIALPSLDDVTMNDESSLSRLLGEATTKGDYCHALKKYFIYMPVVAVVCLIILVNVLESIYRRQALMRVVMLVKRCFRRKKTVQAQTVTATQDVCKERDNTDSIVRANEMENYAIVVSKLCKKFDDFEAVNNISFAVKRGECFGLLGMNGAGKTTTFKMMTRELTITSGNIFFNGICSMSNSGKYKFMLGYCPQADALNNFMTCYQTVKFMAMARGTSAADIDRDVRTLLKNTDLDSYADVQVKNLSGGTKRKVNTALAMQSDPFLVFLDEPTTGVDPASRRFMWSCIQECQKQNKNIVLTSHSMDECEFLCNRLAIMNHGQLNCIGPILELKKTFALGFLVTVLLHPNQSSEDVSRVKAAVSESFDCVLREEYGNQLCYLAVEKTVVWSEVFLRVQSIQSQFDAVVNGISISESSLEDIFLKIARKSHETGAV